MYIYICIYIYIYIHHRSYFQYKYSSNQIILESLINAKYRPKYFKLLC